MAHMQSCTPVEIFTPALTSYISYIYRIQDGRIRFEEFILKHRNSDFVAKSRKREKVASMDVPISRSIN